MQKTKPYSVVYFEAVLTMHQKQGHGVEESTVKLRFITQMYNDGAVYNSELHLKPCKDILPYCPSGIESFSYHNDANKYWLKSRHIAKNIIAEIQSQRFCFRF